MMDWNGKWHNPQHSGEGINISEYKDAKIVAHFYGYNPDGTQIWLIGVGGRIGDSAELAAWVTQGPTGDHTEEVWGTIKLHKQGGSIDVQYRPDVGTPWGYVLEPLYTVPDEPVPVPPPVEPPPVEPPTEPPVEPSTVLKLRYRQMLQNNDWGQWIDIPVPYQGTGTYQDTRIPATNKPWAQAEVTVVKGVLKIDRAVASGEHHPVLLGVKGNQVFNAGENFTAELLLGPQTEDNPGNYSTPESSPNYYVSGDEVGVILNLGMQIAYR